MLLGPAMVFMWLVSSLCVYLVMGFGWVTSNIGLRSILLTILLVGKYDDRSLLSAD